MSAVAEPDRPSTPVGSFLKGTTGVVVFVGIFLAALMGGLDSLVVSTALPTIAVDLHQANGVTFVVSGYLIASTVAIPIFAQLAEMVSLRRVFVSGLTIFIAGSMLAGLSQNLPELIAFRAVQGFGIGGLFPVAIALIAILYPPEQRARLIAILTAAAGISIVAGPLVGSYILDHTTWRWVFYVNLPIGLVSLVTLAVGVGAIRSNRADRFDFVGAATLSGWVGALMLALVQVTEAGWAWGDPRTIALLLAAVVTFAFFLVWELRVGEPIVPLRMLRRRLLAAASGTALFNGIVLSSATTFLSVYVGVVLFGGGPNAADEVRDMLYFFALPMIAGAALSAPLLARFSYRAVSAGGLALGAVSCLFLTALSPSEPLWVLRDGVLLVGGLVAPLIPLGFGSGLALAGVVVAVQNEVPTSEVSRAVGLVRFLQSLGSAVGLSLLTAYQEWRLPALTAGATSPAQVLNGVVRSYTEVFWGLVGVIVVAFAFALFLAGRLSDRFSPRASGRTPSGGSEARVSSSSVDPPDR